MFSLSRLSRATLLAFAGLFVGIVGLMITRGRHPAKAGGPVGGESIARARWRGFRG